MGIFDRPDRPSRGADDGAWRRPCATRGCENAADGGRDFCWRCGLARLRSLIKEGDESVATWPMRALPPTERSAEAAEAAEAAGLEALETHLTLTPEFQVSWLDWTCFYCAHILIEHGVAAFTQVPIGICARHQQRRLSCQPR